MNIVITGCSKGIGLELVKIWSKNHMVYGISRNREKLESLSLSLSNPGNFKFLAKDVVNIDKDDINSFIRYSDGTIKYPIEMTHNIDEIKNYAKGEVYGLKGFNNLNKVDNREFNNFIGEIKKD
jgi:hypothetical protein